MSIVLNEREFAESALETCSLGQKPLETLGRIARYYAADGYKRGEICSLLEEFLFKCDPGINIVKWQNAIGKQAKYACKNGIESVWLFPAAGSSDEQLSATTLNSWAITFSNMLGVDFYWHAMRHYFTTHLARSGLPDGVIQEIIGWSSADMVRVYKDLTTEEQLEQYFDGDGIKSVQPAKLSDL